MGNVVERLDLLFMLRLCNTTLSPIQVDGFRTD